MDVPGSYFMGALAWAAICINLVVIPFFSKSDALFKDLIDSGARDLALTSIDSQKLIPALAQLMEMVLAARDRRVQKGQAAEYDDLLQECNFLPYLTKAQEALSEKRAIEDGLEHLADCASRMWKVGLLHAFSVITFPISLLLSTGPDKVIAATVVVSVSLASLAVLGHGLFHFESNRKKLYRALGKNRGKTNTNSGSD